MWWAAAPILSVIEQNAEIDTIKPTVSISSVNVMGESPKFVNSSYLKTSFPTQIQFIVPINLFYIPKAPCLWTQD
ncbi:hypothetical protein V8V91_26980 [Algoriphagus halophilus]|uniref:hypothetical protein n=1 Tax=Algoriphagus halophilus TaxID=226505 RepID=UPI00358F7606